MKNQKNDQNSQSTVSEKSNKHDANLQQNSTLYFQIGLIVCLLGAYIALEHNFEQYSIPHNKGVVLEEEDVKYIATNYIIEKVEVVNEPKKNKPSVLLEPKIVPDTTPDEVETKNIVKSLKVEVGQGDKLSQLDPNDLGVDPIP